MRTAWGAYFRTLRPQARKKALERWGYDTPQAAIEAGNMDALRFLLDQQASVSQRVNGETALQVAIRKRNFEAVRWIAKCGVSARDNTAYLNARDSNGDTFLAVAAREGDLELASVLLEVGARVDLRNKEGYTALMLAALNGNLEMARLLLEHGARVDRGRCRCYRGLSKVPICEAIRGGNLEVVKLFVERGANLYEREPSGFRPLELARELARAEACGSPLSREAGPFPRKSLRSLQGTDPNPEGSGPDASGDATGASLVAIVKYLQERVSVIGEVDDDGNTELMLAVMDDDLERVRSLLSGGQDGGLKNKDDRTVLHYAVLNLNFSMVRFLVENSLEVRLGIDCRDRWGCTALMYASRNGALEIVKFLLGAGAGVNVRVEKEKTPYVVLRAKKKNKLLVTEYRRSARVEVSSVVGYTALTYAAKRGRTEVVEFLLESKADINVRDCYERTVLMHALWGQESKLEVVKLLVEDGSDLRARDLDGSSVLHFAAIRGVVSVLGYLLDRGVDVDGVNYSGWTSLMQASQRGLISSVQFLVERGASVDARDGFGRTALFFAVESGKIGVVRYLLERGAKADVRDEFSKKTALDVAREAGNQDIVELLLAFGATELRG